MSDKSVSKRHSETALFAALCRAVASADVPGEKSGKDQFAELFLPAFLKFIIRFKAIRNRFRAKNKLMTPGAYEYLIARTIFFDQVFIEGLKDEVPQIVMLGAGYDTRAYRFHDLSKNTRIYELDVPTTQKRKKQHLQKARMEMPGNVILIPIDFNKDSLISALEKAGYDSNAQTLFIWEGVTMYLEDSAVQSTFEQISANKKNSVAFDYVITTRGDNVDQLYGVKEFMETWQKHRKGEPFQFSIIEADLCSLLARYRFQITKNMGPEEMHETFLTSDDDKITGFFRFAIASSAEPDRSIQQ